MDTKCILIVDDDFYLRKTLSDILRAKGYAPTGATTGKAALDRVEEEKPVVALIDLRLEDTSGLEMVREIKKRSSGTECIVLTEYASQSSAIEAINLGAYSYMQKPYDVEQLLVTIRRAIEKQEAEEALRESEDRYQDLVEHSHDLLCTHDLEGQILSANQGIAKLLGYDQSVLLKKNIRDILVPEVRDEFDTYLATIRRHGVASGLMLVQTSTGERRIWKYNNTLRTEGVAAPIVRGMAHDITERRQAERERERRTQELVMLNEIGRAVTSSLDLKEVLALLLDRTHQGLDAEACSVALLDANGELVFYHAEGEAAEAVIGLRLKPGQGIAGHVAQSGQSTLVPDVHAHPHFYGEVAPDFTTRDMVCVPLVVRDEIIGVIELLNKHQGTFTEDDVRLLESVATQAATAIENARLFELTQRQSERLAQTLAVSESLHRGLKLEQVLEQVAQGAVKLGFRRAAINVYQLEEELVRIQAVAGFEGPEREMLMGATYHWPEFQTLMQERFLVSRSYLIRQGEIDWERDYQGVTVSSDIEDRGPGYWRPDDALLVPLWGTGGQPVGVLWVDEPVDGLLPDLNMIQTLEAFANQAAIAIENARLYEAIRRELAERKQLEAQLRQAQKMTAIGQLAGGICHDFNNLLTPIGGFAELLLLKAPEDSQQHEYLRQIKIAAERAAALTRQLRLFTRQAAGERHPVQLNSVVEETHELLKRSIPKEITIELCLESELWAVEADPSQISQVLMNLCVNARDAMSEGGILTLETRNVILDEEGARAILGAQPGRYVCLTVSDTGCGMSPEVQARLFEPFFTTKEVGKGTGLGLAVVYGIVQGHDGFIQVYSQEGRGSTFHVYLPAVESAVKEREVEWLALPTGTETILVVDDEEMVQALGQRVLELCGYTVLMAEDGVQALEVYQAHQEEIALVVLDVIMPQMGGLECLHRLRELDPQVKVLISTGYTARGLAQELVTEGALGVVEKPFRLHDFATAVRAALDKS